MKLLCFNVQIHLPSVYRPHLPELHRSVIFLTFFSIIEVSLFCHALHSILESDDLILNICINKYSWFQLYNFMGSHVHHYNVIQNCFTTLIKFLLHLLLNLYLPESGVNTDSLSVVFHFAI